MDPVKAEVIKELAFYTTITVFFVCLFASLAFHDYIVNRYADEPEDDTTGDDPDDTGSGDSDD